MILFYTKTKRNVSPKGIHSDGRCKSRGKEKKKKNSKNSLRPESLQDSLATVFLEHHSNNLVSFLSWPQRKGEVDRSFSPVMKEF